MNWYTFIFAAWLFFGLELGLKHALALGDWGVAPSFVVPLAVYVSMAAPPSRAVWACLILGIGLDLTWSPPTAQGPGTTIVGPYALGLMLGGQLVLALRSMMIRRNPLTMTFLTLLASLVMHVVVMAMLAARSLFGDSIGVGGVGGVGMGGQALARLGSSAYTALAGFVMALLLLPMSAVFGFHLGQGRYVTRRA